MRAPVNPLGEYVPPYSIEAEQSVLGAMLIDSNAVISASEIVDAGDFYRDCHQSLFDTILAIFARNEPVDLVTVQEELRKRDKLEVIGGMAYLTSLFEAVPTTANVEYYARIVEEKAVQRRLISAGLEVIAVARGEVEDIQATINAAQSAVMDVRAKRVNERARKTIGRIGLDVWRSIEDAADNGTSLASITTGFGDWDRCTGGFRPGNMVVIACRPGLGKSSLGFRVADFNASQEGRSVLLCSQEMSAEEVYERMLSARSQVLLHVLRSGRMNREESDRAQAAGAALNHDRLHVLDTSGLSPARLRAECQAMKRERGLDMVVVDYIGLMRPDRQRKDETEALTEIARELKVIARELGVVMVVLAQLNRATESRKDMRPMLGDLRGSGEIEAAADFAYGLYNANYYTRQAGTSANMDGLLEERAEIITLKARFGPSKVIHVGFHPAYTRFFELPSRGGTR